MHSSLRSTTGDKPASQGPSHDTNSRASNADFNIADNPRTSTKAAVSKKTDETPGDYIIKKLMQDASTLQLKSHTKGANLKEPPGMKASDADNAITKRRDAIDPPGVSLNIDGYTMRAEEIPQSNTKPSGSDEADKKPKPAAETSTPPNASNTAQANKASLNLFDRVQRRMESPESTVQKLCIKLMDNGNRMSPEETKRLTNEIVHTMKNVNGSQTLVDIRKTSARHLPESVRDAAGRRLSELGHDPDAGEMSWGWRHG